MMKTLPRALEALYSTEGAPRLSVRRWGMFAASAVLAGVCAALAYRALDLPLRYPEPIVGNLAWSASNKFHDYAAPLVFVAAQLIGLAAMAALARRIENRIGADAEERFHDFLCMASAPAGLWLASLITTRDASFALLNVSGAAVAAVLSFALVLSLRSPEFWRRDAARFASILGELILFIPAVWLSVCALGVASSRLLALRQAATVITSEDVARATLIFVVLAATAALATIRAVHTPERLQQLLRRALLAVQVTFPGFFLLLVPRPWTAGGRQAIGYGLTSVAWVCIAACAAAALWVLLRQWFRLDEAPRASPVDAFTAMSIIGALLFLKTLSIYIPSVTSDDYHFGEMLVPWWSLIHHHLVPFAEYSPARGLVNYLPGAAAAGFFDGTAASFTAVDPFIYLALLLVAVPVLRRTIGLGWTALALCVAPYINGWFEIDVVVTLFLALMGRGFTRWGPRVWIPVWIVCGTALVLYAPGQGGLSIVATAPLGVFMCVRGVKEDFRPLSIALGILLIIAVAAGTLTPIGPMVWGAVRYGLEQSAVNSVAHGIAWKESFATSDANPVLYELMRASWLLVAAWAGVLILRLRSTRVAEARREVLPFAIPIFLLTMLYVFRAAGRIDPDPSRLGVASIWALALLLPLLFATSSRSRPRGGMLFVWLTLVGVVFPHESALATSYADQFEPIPVEEAASSARARWHVLPVIGASVGVPGLGVALAEPSHVARLVNARTLLDKVLDPGETYLDLSSRHAQYFYLDRRPPIETGAIYNLVTEAQQLRAIESLRRNMPPAVLLAADNILHDGGPIGLRSALMYRYVLLNPGYRTVESKGLVWLVRNDRLPRLAESDATISDVDDSPASPLHGILRTENLGKIPTAWGMSASNLEPRMRPVLELQAPSSGSVERSADGRYRPSGPDSLIRFEMSGSNLGGRDAGILSFDFHCERIGPDPVLEVSWATDRNAEGELTTVRFDGTEGRLIVPLDAAPAWLLARRIRSIRFGVGDKASCSTFSVENVRLLQRHGAS